MGRTVLVTDAGEKELPGKCSIATHKGDVIRIETSGGGGWGAK